MIIETRDGGKGKEEEEEEKEEKEKDEEEVNNGEKKGTRD